MPADNAERHPRLHLPYITIFVAVLVPAVTLIYSALVPSVGENNIILFISSPFNIIYEEAFNGILYNYWLFVFIFGLVELYSRYVADLKNRDSILDHAFVISIVASYASSAIIWLVLGMPSSGTSVLAFCMLLFFISEITDSELIHRLRERHRRKGYTLEILTFSYASILFGISTLVFSYINTNQFWYIHIIGGAIFALIFSLYAVHLKILRGPHPHGRHIKEFGEAFVFKD